MGSLKMVAAVLLLVRGYKGQFGEPINGVHCSHMEKSNLIKINGLVFNWPLQNFSSIEVGPTVKLSIMKKLEILIT